MNNHMRVLGLVIIVLGLAATAQAQDCRESSKTPPAGSWAEWRGTRNDFMRKAVLAEETREGKAYLRIEYRGGEDNQTMLTMQILALKEPPQTPEEMIVKMGAMIPMRIPKESLAKAPPVTPDPTQQACTTNMTLLGQETITVPGGTFVTSRFKDTQAGHEFWLSPKVPFGIVKARLAGEPEQTLAAFGTDAKSGITEPPINMPRE